MRECKDMMAARQPKKRECRDWMAGRETKNRVQRTKKERVKRRDGR